MTAIRRVLTAALAGLLLAPAALVSPAHGDSPATGQIAGSVLDSGRPVAGALVEAVDYDYPWLTPGAAGALTDAAGGFRLTGVPPGRWWVRTTLPGGWLRQFYPATQDLAAAVPVTVTAGGTATVSERVLPHGALTGRITTSTGAPAAGAVVTMPHHAYVVRATADADGRYLLDYLPPVTSPFFFARGLDAPQQSVTVTVILGERVTVDQQLAPAGAVTGS